MSELRRRSFLKIVGVGGAAAGATTLGGCSYPETYLYSPPVAQESWVPGVPMFYATTCRECDEGCGLVARVREGRVIKAEGNPEHPMNRGRTCALGQASVQGLYNPDRLKGPLVADGRGGFRPIGWADAQHILVTELGKLRRAGQGRQAVFITGALSGSLERLVDRWVERVAGGARRLAWEPLAMTAEVAAARLAFGLDDVPRYDIAKARHLVSFGADFLDTWGSTVEQTRQFTAMHAYAGQGRPGTFVAVEARRSLTGQNADQWIAPRPGTEGLVALAMAHVILRENLGRPPAGQADGLRRATDAYAPGRVAEQADVPVEVIERLAREFAGARPSLALGGGKAATGPNATATIVATHVLNAVAGNLGETVLAGRAERAPRRASGRDMVELVRAMKAGQVPMALVYGANPVYDTPAGLQFAEAFRNVPFKVGFSTYPDETTLSCNLILPDRHFFESWGDAEPREGVHSLVQPVMPPLEAFDTRPIGDVLIATAKASGEAIASAFPQESFEAFLRAEWQQLHREAGAGGDFETFWRQALARGGYFADSPGRPVQLAEGAAQAVAGLAAPKLGGGGDVTLVVYPSPMLLDGRGANRPWLQEVPDPVTKISWWSWVEMHPDLANRLGLRAGQDTRLSEPRGVLLPFPTTISTISHDVVAIETEAGRIEAPVYVNPYMRRDVVAVAMGQGHERYGRYAQADGQPRGVNAMKALPVVLDEPSGAFAWVATTARVSRTGAQRMLATTAGADTQAGRNIYRALPVAEAEKKTPVSHRHDVPGPAMVPPVHSAVPYHWGMVVDLDKCTGCQACVVACYAENNLAVVGEAQVARGREMSWIRIERYFEPDGTVTHAPMLCVHCGNAPCETVCPVYAAYHNPEGLNAQVYNRCVGTRYCGNNCPYKVRYFNWYDYSRESYGGDPNPAYAYPYPLNLQLNPSVTVRSVGVMEKCTMCIQRINAAKDAAKDQGRHVRDGEFDVACAQACPTEALVFGNLKEPNSRVAKLRQDPRNYAVLEELDTDPSITHMAKVVLSDAPAGAGRAAGAAH
jgi:molybdopterin-containing oxidoreductase family iron-sulfur binding subunit